MASPTHDILIVGAGVLGLSTASVLHARGHAVTVVDAGGPNASSVAAGMIAPAMESAAEDVTPQRAALYRDAAAQWPGFAARAGIDLVPAMAEWRGDGWDRIADRLTALGFAAETTERGVRAPQDLRLSPTAALERLADGVRRIEGRVETVVGDVGGWGVRLTDGRTVSARVVVLATGADEGLDGLAPSVQAVLGAATPVRGQIGFVGQMLTDRTLRGSKGYVTPVEGGVVIGATMEAGRRDLAPDVETSERLRRAAEDLLERSIDPAAIDWCVGVRGASPDGLPLAGLAAPGLAVALAPRRNGWMLGPLVGEIVADAVENRAPRAEAAAFDPLRFSRAG